MKILTFVGLTAALASWSAPAPAPGLAYTLTSKTTADGDMSAAMPGGGASAWQGRVTVLNGRGRTDITDGSVQGMFSKGDYMLFDTADCIIVDPAAKTYFVFGAAATMGGINRMMSSGAMGGMKLTISNAKSTIDTILGHDSVSGYPVRHFRVTSTYGMSFDMSALGVDLGGMAPPTIGTTLTMELWTAAIPRFAENPLMRSRGSAAGLDSGPMAPIGAAMASAMAGLPHEPVLRSAVKTEISAGPAGGQSFTITSDVSAIEQKDVDPASLILPGGFTQIQPPTAAMDPNPAPLDPAAGAKWQKPPQR